MGVKRRVLLLLPQKKWSLGSEDRPAVVDGDFQLVKGETKVHIHILLACPICKYIRWVPEGNGFLRHCCWRPDVLLKQLGRVDYAHSNSRAFNAAPL